MEQGDGIRRRRVAWRREPSVVRVVKPLMRYVEELKYPLMYVVEVIRGKLAVSPHP